MKYSEVGFRAMYHTFCVIPLKNFKDVVKYFPHIEESDYLLVYGYIDRQTGMTLEILAGGQKLQDKFCFFDTTLEFRSMLRASAIKDDEFFLLDDSANYLRERYAAKIDKLSFYNASSEVEETRKMSFLDGVRHPLFPDDVQVYLLKTDLQPEICWARISGLGNHGIMATLLNEPYQDFGRHKNEEIVFFVQKNSDEKFICFSNIDPS